MSKGTFPHVALNIDNGLIQREEKSHWALGRNCSLLCQWVIPVSILNKSIAGRYRPVRVDDGPITARYRFIQNASWDVFTFRPKIFIDISEDKQH